MEIKVKIVGSILEILGQIFVDDYPTLVVNGIL